MTEEYPYLHVLSEDDCRLAQATAHKWVAHNRATNYPYSPTGWLAYFSEEVGLTYCIGAEIAYARIFGLEPHTKTAKEEGYLPYDYIHSTFMVDVKTVIRDTDPLMVKEKKNGRLRPNFFALMLGCVEFENYIPKKLWNIYDFLGYARWEYATQGMFYKYGDMPYFSVPNKHLRLSFGEAL